MSERESGILPRYRVGLTGSRIKSSIEFTTIAVWLHSTLGYLALNTGSGTGKHAAYPVACDCQVPGQA